MGSLLANGTRSMRNILHTFYTNTRVLIPPMTFYDIKYKLKSVKTPIAAKPSGISPNYTCQCSLVILWKLQYKPKPFFHSKPPLCATQFMSHLIM